MPDLDFEGLRTASAAAFRPEYADVVRRAGRRRRRRVKAVGALTAVAVAAVPVALRAAPSGDRPAPTVVAPSPTPPYLPDATRLPSNRPGTTEPQQMVAADADHLFARFTECGETTCRDWIVASADRGRTWERRAVPDGHVFELIAVTADVLVVNPGDTRWWQVSRDGGRTWRKVTSAPPGEAPADWPRIMGTPVVAVNPATGDLTAVQPWSVPFPYVAGGGVVPAGAGVWLSGYAEQHDVPHDTFDRRIRGVGSRIAVSHDDGRTWFTYAVPEELYATDNGYFTVGASLAVVDADTAYAVGRVGSVVRIYRTTDGGRTWTRTGATADAGTRSVQAGVVDGTLHVRVGTAADRRGAEQVEDPDFYVSTDGGESLSPVAPGPGSSAVPVPGGWVEPDRSTRGGLWLYTDRFWEFVAPPAP